MLANLLDLKKDESSNVLPRLRDLPNDRLESLKWLVLDLDFRNNAVETLFTQLRLH